MAATHTYVILSATAIGDLVTIVGSVDGISVSITIWKSALPKLSTVVAVNNFIFPLMLAAAIPPIPVVVSQIPSQSVTQ